MSCQYIHQSRRDQLGAFPHWHIIVQCLSHIQPWAPYDFYHPYDFLPERPCKAPVGILRQCCSRGCISLRARFGLTRLYTYGLVEWFAGLHGYPVRCPCRHHTDPARKSFPILQDPQGCHTTPLWTHKGIDRNPAQKSYLAIGARTGPFWSPHGLFTSCLGSQNLYGAWKLIMHTLKLYRPHTGRQNSYGAALGPCGPREWMYNFCSKQPVNSPYVAWECDVTGTLNIVQNTKIFW